LNAMLHVYTIVVVRSIHLTYLAATGVRASLQRFA